MKAAAIFIGLLSHADAFLFTGSVFMPMALVNIQFKTQEFLLGKNKFF
jgi:hypothetical protein